MPTSRAGDRLTGGNAGSKDRDRFALLVHLCEVTSAEFGPVDRRSVLAVKGGVQLAARTELRRPRVPGLGVLADAPGAVPADKQAVAVARFDEIVPALGLDASTSDAPPHSGRLRSAQNWAVRVAPRLRTR
jgi:hypothetical protein